MTSAAFTMNGIAGSLAVASGTTVNLALLSTTGVRSVTWSIAGKSDSAQTTPTITTSGTPDGVTATVELDSGADEGFSVLLKCVVNGGVDDSGFTDSALTATGLLAVSNLSGRIPFSVGETFERDAVTGVAKEFNERPVLAGTLVYLTPPTLGASADDYGPTDFGPADVVRISTSSDGLSLTGLDSSRTKSPKFLLNAGTHTFSLKHNDSGSQPQNRFLLAGAAEVFLIANKVVQAWWDPVDVAWKLA